jgi:ribose-phosphate pyrophosphokinase
MRILEAVMEVNEDQKLRIVDRVVEQFGADLTGRTFGVWGLAFKPETDDMREAPSITIIKSLLARGAKEVRAYITHGVLSGGAVARISSSKLKELVVTDSIQPTEAVRVASNIRVISIAPLMGEAIARTAKEESVSSLFD